MSEASNFRLQRTWCSRCSQHIAAEPGVGRAGLEAEETRLEQAIERLLDHLEAGEDVGLRLKQRRAELDALRVRMAEPEGFDLDEARFEKELAKNAEWLRWRGPVIKANDVAQTRHAIRALGIGKITVTPTPTVGRSRATAT